MVEPQEEASLQVARISSISRNCWKPKPGKAARAANLPHRKSLAVRPEHSGAGSLDTYRRMRDFRRTPEPRGKRERRGAALRFVIQKHAARRLPTTSGWRDGVFRSWAIQKGPEPGSSARSAMAAEVEDHPLGNTAVSKA